MGTRDSVLIPRRTYFDWGLEDVIWPPLDEKTADLGRKWKSGAMCELRNERGTVGPSKYVT